MPDASTEDLPERVLVVTAHPDDVDFGAAGTVATWTRAGVQVTYAIVTDGDAGGFDPDVPRSQIPGIRQAEQRAAAKTVGVDDVRFLGYTDGELVVSLGLRRDISRVIRQVRPQRLLCQSPERNWERLPASHPDHMAAGEAAIQAVYPDARNPFAHPVLLQDEGLDAWTVPEIWVMGGPRPNRWVDVTDAFDDKIAALQSHASQVAHRPELPDFVRTWSGRLAEAGGLPEGRLAEAFMVVAVP
ncbi:MAG: PIG-L deacetylase family protein [Actinomycetes bacterium]